MGITGCGQDSAKTAGKLAASEPLPVPLVTGRSIEPRPTSVQSVGSIPVNMIASPDGKFVITTDQGFTQQLWSTRVADGVGISKLNFSRGSTNGLYYGLAFGPDGTLYAAQGANDSILVARLDESGKVTRQGTIKSRVGDFPSGLAVDKAGHLYVANNDTNGAKTQPYKLPGSVAIYDTAAGKEIGRYAFTESFGGTPNFPMAIAALWDGSKAYVGSQRDAAVYVLNTSDPAQPKLVATLATGAPGFASIGQIAIAPFRSQCAERHGFCHRYENRSDHLDSLDVPGDCKGHARRDAQRPGAIAG